MLNKATVEVIAALYPGGKQGDRESQLFSPSFRHKITARGYLELEELIGIVIWKSKRLKTTAAKNTPRLVEQVTSLAFSVDDPGLSNWILCYLRGVQSRMASAILTVFNPDRYTMMDDRAWNALDRLGLLSTLGL